jgi:hypothetical protein
MGWEREENAHCISRLSRAWKAPSGSSNKHFIKKESALRHFHREVVGAIVWSRVLAT